MDEAPAPDAPTLLVYVLDEMCETANLLRVADLNRSTRRPWWRNAFYGVIRTKSEVTAGFALQYLGENIDRARDHWREALAPLDDLRDRFGATDWVAQLDEELHAAGVNEVLARLAHEAIPRPTADAAAHISGVLSTIGDCSALITRTRSQLALRRMRDEQV